MFLELPLGAAIVKGRNAEMLAGLNVRRAVLSVAGIDDRGCFNSNLLLVETERAMMQAADEVIIVADSTKFGHRSLALMCGLEDVDCLVADAETPAPWRDKLTVAGVQVIVAGDAGVPPGASLE